MAITSPTFQASGLASGLDTASLIDKIIAADSAPITQLASRKAAYSIQISTIASLTSALSSLQSVSDNLATSGVTATKANDTYADFTVTGSAPTQATYRVQVEKLALAAKARSTTFASANDAVLVPDGNLQFSLDGSATAAIDTTGKTLAQIASAINSNIPQLSASIMATGSTYMLSVIRKDTGYATSADAALQITQDPGLGLATVQAAQNARLYVDNVTIDSRSNAVSNVISGVTLNLRAASNVATDVNFVTDQTAAIASVQKFADAYNGVAKILTSQLHVNAATSQNEAVLEGSTVQLLQRQMQKLLSKNPVSTGGVRVLADLGLQLQKDGTLNLDQGLLAKALAADPDGVNRVFATASTGVAAQVDALVKAQTNAGTGDVNTGALVSRSAALKKNIAQIDDRTTRLQASLDAERRRLTAQFNAMEQTISSLNSLASYLTNLDAQRNKSNG